MFNKGHIIVKRTIKEKGWYHNPVKLSVMIHLLTDANFTDQQWDGFTIRRGQLLTTYAELARDCGASLQEVRTAFKSLIASGEVSTQQTKRKTLVTICNYESYQSEQHLDNIQATSYQHSNNIETTSEQQLILEQGNKETREEKKVSDDTKEKKFVRPTVEQVAEFCKEQGYNIDPEQFVNYYDSKGWLVGKSPMKDWKAAVRTWVRNDRDRAPYANHQKNAPTPAPQPQYGLFNLSDLRKPQSVADYGE